MTDSFGILRKIQKYVFHDMLKIFLTMHCHKKNLAVQNNKYLQFFWNDIFVCIEFIWMDLFVERQ